mmetsp:Transcript_84292/g.133572  ORF Transcript_84292/g.133572 Transcript_84292/m.133572 type:complete len:233 (-) Transcript_84292:211-909(-)
MEGTSRPPRSSGTATEFIDRVGSIGLISSFSWASSKPRRRRLCSVWLFLLPVICATAFLSSGDSTSSRMSRVKASACVKSRKLPRCATCTTSLSSGNMSSTGSKSFSSITCWIRPTTGPCPGSSLGSITLILVRTMSKLSCISCTRATSSFTSFSALACINLTCCILPQQTTRKTNIPAQQSNTSTAIATPRLLAPRGSPEPSPGGAFSVMLVTVRMVGTTTVEASDTTSTC